MGSTAGKSAPEEPHAHGTRTTHNDTTMPQLTRRAHHAGSWYESDPATLRRQLTGFLQAAAAANDATTTDAPTALRAIVCPHAGYSYSGPTAGYSYHALARELNRPDGSPIRKIVVLHPSHHVSLRSKCAVSSAHVLATPLGTLTVDEALRTEMLSLSSTYFTTMSLGDDEHEHSGEMQYPFLAHCLHDGNIITVTPVMCGSLSTTEETAVGALLAPLLARPDVLTVVSTDFCHWGARFRYQPISDTHTNLPIFDVIERLDRRGMTDIEAQQPGGFATYLHETGNTICGRHAVAVWLRALVYDTNDGATVDNLHIRFVHYAQSSRARSLSDSSVSYAAAVATVPRPVT